MASLLDESMISNGKALSIVESGRLSVLAVVPYPPNPLRPRTVSMLADISSFADIDLLYLDDGDPIVVPKEVQLKSVRSFPNRAWHRVPRVAAGCVLGKPIVYQYYHSRQLVRHLAATDLSTYDAVYIERIPLQDLNVRHPFVVLDMQDCYSLLVPQLAAASAGLKKWAFKLDSFNVKRYERQACNLATRVLCTADREASGLRSVGVTTPIDVVVHCGPSVQPSGRRVIENDPRVLSFHGKLTYSPNIAALGLLRNILKKLNSSDYQVIVAGAGADKVQKMYPEFQFVGYVNDIAAHLKSTDLSILPVELNAGISNKALESLSVGVPIVTTPQIAAGLPGCKVIFEEGVFVRHPDEFPETIESYFRMPLASKQAIADKCVSYVEDLCDDAPRREYLRSRVFGGFARHKSPC